MKLAGKAMTVLMTDVYGPQKKPFGLLTEALDQLKENEIYIAAGGTKRCAYWGELLTAAARTRKASGTVVNGWHREDVYKRQELLRLIIDTISEIKKSIMITPNVTINFFPIFKFFIKFINRLSLVIMPR